MAVNKNALIRYKTIDKCLQNSYRKWTLQDLIEACSDALYEYEGKDTYVSKRTVQLDIQMMRSDKLGYNAPISVYERKYYKYENADYSITSIPISDQDLEQLSDAVSFLKQFKGFSHFRELEGMVQKLEDHVYSQKTNETPIIDFEKNENLKGIDFLDQLYKSILNKRAIEITYKSFKAREENTFVFHPYLLKEYRNRWFVIGVKKKREGILNLALDRIISITISEENYKANTEYDFTTYYKNAIGVSVSPTLPTEKVVLYIKHAHAPYILTKPFHPSQELISKDNYGVTISLDIQHNFELEKEILGLGENIKVISPPRLRRNIIDRIQETLDTYDTEITEAGLKTAKSQLAYKGFSILNYVYTKREIKRIKKALDQYFKEVGYGVRTILKKVPKLKSLLLNNNLNKILQELDHNVVLTKAIYFDKPAKSNWYVTWHQDVPINVSEKIETEGYTSWTYKKEINSVCPPEEILKKIITIRIHLDDTHIRNGALEVIPGSHKKRLNDQEIQLITKNSIPYTCDVLAGGIQLMKPLLLHASSKAKSYKRRRVLHLEFSSEELPNGLTWLEKEVLETI